MGDSNVSAVPGPVTGTVWVVEVESRSDRRHVHGVYASESRAHDAVVVELMTTHFADRWAANNVRTPHRIDFPTDASWRQAVLSTWTLVDAPDITIAWDEWQPL